MPDPYQIFYDEADKLNQPKDQQPYPTPATDLAISRASKLKAAEEAYYHTKNSQPGFVDYNNPGAMDEGTFQGLIQALKPQPIGGQVDRSKWPRSEVFHEEMANEEFAKDAYETEHPKQTVEEKWNQIRDEMTQRDREGAHKTFTMNMGGEEWEIPANPEDVGMTEEQFDALGDDPSKWPPNILDTFEKLARDKLEMGYDPFGNRLDQEIDDNGNPLPAPEGTPDPNEWGP